MRKTNAGVGLSSLFLIALLPAVTGLAHADTVISTIPSWDGFGFVLPFGAPDTETYGQIITVPSTDPVLESWTFYMKQDTATQFQGEVYAWNGTMATGPGLFESAVMTTTNAYVFQPITFNTGGLALTPGQMYVLFASSSKGNQSSTGHGEWGSIPHSNAYAGGAFAFINNGADPSEWTSDPWSTFGNTDLAFKADFDSPAAVPEPPAQMLSATILFAMFVVTRLGRKAATR